MSEQVSSEEVRAKRREYKKRYRAEKKAMELATGKALPKEPRPIGRPKSVVNKVTEYGALFNQLNEERVNKGFKPLVTAMETLIEAMQPENGLEIKDRARIAEKIATFESSRAPVISIEHVQNIQKDEELDAEDALEDFLTSIRKV
jgi:hypothetical protein